MIGDIDQIPLQKKYFYSSIKDIPEDYYCHLNYHACGQNLGIESNKWNTIDGEKNGGFELPAHYHVAKGKTFFNTLNLHLDFEEQIKILTNGNYGLGTLPHSKHFTKDSEQYYWLAEEQYSSEMIRRKFNSGLINFFGHSYDNRNEKICRSSSQFPSYNYDINKLLNGSYIDVHCHRPYKDQEEHLNSLLKNAFGEEFE